MPYPLPLTRTEAYLAYKAGVIQQPDLKPSLAIPRNGIDEWLAYWTGLAADYPKREDGTPHILQEEEAYIAYLCGVINEYPEKCLRRVGAYLRYLISARWGRPDHPLNREELYLSLIKTQFIPSGEPSSDITIDRTAKAPFVDVKLYGDTYQQTYTGKNLFNENEPKSTYYIDGNGNEEDTGRYDYINIEYSVSGGEDMTVSFASKVGVAYVRIAQFRGDGTFIQRPLVSTSPTTVTLSSDARKIILSVNQSNTLYFTGLQVEYGSTASAYEPFVGGQPSPSPDYPQPIQTVTGLQTVEIHGKNLLNLADRTATERGVSISMSNSNVLTLDGTATSTGDSFFYYNTGIKITQDSILKGSVLDGTAVGGALLALKLRVVKSDSSVEWVIARVGTPLRLLVGSTITQFYLGLTSGTVFTNYKVGIQLEKGSTATTYEPYSSNNYEINLGKNLFDKAAATPKTTLNGDGSLGFSNDYSTSDFISVNPSTVYYKSQTSSARFKFYDQNKTPLSSVYDDIPIAGPPQSFTTPNNCYYIRFSFATINSDTIQIEAGSQATTYAPYFDPIELRKISEGYVDYIWKDGDDWKIHKATGKEQLTGTESWQFTPNGNAWYVANWATARGARTPQSNDDVGAIKCADFTAVARNSLASITNGIVIASSAALNIKLDGYTTSGSNFAGWVAENKPVVYYSIRLASQTDTAITDTNLIAQLEALVAGGAENGTTYIKVNATDPNLPGLLYVEAPKYE